MAGIFIRRLAPTVTFRSQSRLIPIDPVLGSMRLCSMWRSGVVMSPQTVVGSDLDHGLPPDRA